MYIGLLAPEKLAAAIVAMNLSFKTCSYIFIQKRAFLIIILSVVNLFQQKYQC